MPTQGDGLASADYVIETAGDGALSLPTIEQHVDTILARLAAAESAVLHFHGGLVSRTAGLKIADALILPYRRAGAEPVFFVWQSGIVETVVNNLREMFGTRSFVGSVIRFCATSTS
jgi:hypothetical protein